VADVRVKNLRDRNGNSHLTLNSAGPLGVGQTLDLGGDDLTKAGTVSGDNLDVESANDLTLVPNNNSDGVGCCVRVENNNGDTILEVRENGEVKTPRLDSGGGVGRPVAVESSDGELVRDVDVDLDGNNLEDAGTTIWDSGNSRIGTNGVTTASIAADAVGTNELDAGAVAGSNLSGGGGTLDVDSTIVTDDLTLRGDVGDSNVARINLNSFASASGGNIDIGARNTVTCTGSVVPNTDNKWNLGESGTRWSTVYAANGVSTSSDARLKQNVADLSNPLDRLRDIRPVSYEWNDREAPDTRLGFIAQELDDAVPEAVDRPDDEDAPLGVAYDMVLPVAVGAIQEQQDRIETLEAEAEDLRAENAALRERNENLEARLDALEGRVEELADER
jgi:FtsZ-binding cell division protein ZapB